MKSRGSGFCVLLLAETSYYYRQKVYALSPLISPLSRNELIVKYRYPDVRVQVPGCASTGTRMCEYRYPDVGVQVPWMWEYRSGWVKYFQRNCSDRRNFSHGEKLMFTPLSGDITVHFRRF